jgi:hypothetical protein
MSARLAAPHDALFELAESVTLGACDALANDVEEVRNFDQVADWLEAANHVEPLRRIVDGFDLEPAECALVVLLFAAALSERVARRIADATTGGGQGVPVWFTQRLIPDLRADALAASGALRRYGFVAIEQGALRVEARIWLREPVLDRLCGAPALEAEGNAAIMRAHVHPVLANDILMQQLQTALVDRCADRLSPVVFAGNTEIATLAASLAGLGLAPHVIRATDIPDQPDARDKIARTWSRDAALDAAALVVIANELGGSTIADFVDRVAGHVVIAGQRPAAECMRDIRILPDQDLRSTTAADRWRRALGPARARKVGAGTARVASHFRLNPAEIDAVCAHAANDIDKAANSTDATRVLWHAAGRVSPGVPVPGLSLVEPVYGWEDIVLAPAIESALRRVEMHVRHASTVLDEWGFGEQMGSRGRGVVALFAGPSGTGKTMAAEVLASSLDLRMLVIDLSQIISKYIGETSKNVAAAFDLAERSGAVMVWNEGDAIWGARGNVGNATDRHVNAEIGDLLQRIEAFRGFTIVTTNMRHAIDPAFLRRFRFAIDFPMPSESERLRLWRQVFPTAAPVAVVDWQALAALPLSGGSIRNVALGAAFLAAESGCRIDGDLIAAELAEELRKQDQPMPAIAWGSGV